MAAWQLVNLWKAETGGSVSDIRMSADGQYLLVKGGDRLMYFNWGPELLWQGSVHGTWRHVAVGSSREQVLIASDKMICSCSIDGNLRWGGSTEWKVECLYLNAEEHRVAASSGARVGCLNEDGQPIWQHEMRGTVRSVAISSHGQWILAGGEDNRVTCLNPHGQLRWTSQFDGQIVSIAAGEGMIAVGDAGKIVHCLNGDGHELCYHEMDGKIKGVAISVTGNYIVVGTENELHQFLLTDATFLFVPVQPKQAGARAALERLGTENVHNVFMNYDGSCLLVEGAVDGQCYDLEGNLLWSCPKIDATKLQQEEEPPLRDKRRQLPQEPPVSRELAEARRAGEKLLVQQTRRAFTKYAYSQSRRRTREAQAQENVLIGGQVLDLSFDGKGYLFVTTAGSDTIQRAAGLATHMEIYIIAYNASDSVVQDVKRTKGVNLYQLSDMIKATGPGESSGFETFMLRRGKGFSAT